jgi:hypothetical protein
MQTVGLTSLSALKEIRGAAIFSPRPFPLESQTSARSFYFPFNKLSRPVRQLHLRPCYPSDRAAQDRHPPMIKLHPRSCMTNPIPTPIPNPQPQCQVLIRHQRKGLPWDREGFSRDVGFVFSKQQVERHAQHLIRQSPAFYAPTSRPRAAPTLTGAAF